VHLVAVVLTVNQEVKLFELEKIPMEIEPDLTPEQKDAITKYRVIVDWADGYSFRDIENRTGVARGTIFKWIKKFKDQNGDVMFDKRVYNHRPEALDANSKATIISSLRSNSRITLSDLKINVLEENNADVSITPIYSYVRRLGDYKYPFTVPFLSENNQDKRFTFPKNHIEDHFSNVLFTDECRVELWRSTRKVFVFKQESIPQLPKPNPNPSILIWGAISRKGALPLRIVKPIINQEVLKNVPKEADILFNGKTWRFQQDNAPAHKAIAVTNWLNDRVPAILQHPPQSPDLNPIEQTWSWLKSFIEGKSPNTQEDLQAAIEEAWESLTLKLMNSWIDHLCNILTEVVEKKGCFTGS